MESEFLGLNNFVWWFGVVEDRLDPLELGRCKIRCFGWHTSDVNQIRISDLPWAHPIVPYGAKAVQPPAEGTMVFGFFADGKEGHYPIILGTVPGIPDERRQNNMGFTDPYTDEEKAALDFPRKIKEAFIKADSRGVQVTDDVPKRNPVNLNEPSISRLARPVRGSENGVYDGIDPNSIANTTIDIQRKTRVVNVMTAKGSTWDEPFPAFNAMYPFNHVLETESGHAFEMDDTNEFERVQLSHRTGSTLEFLPEGHTKIKSQKGRYDVTMGDHRNYINGDKYETIDSNLFLRVNGNIRIECDNFEVVSNKTVNMAAGTTAQVKAAQSLSLSSVFSTLSGGTVDIKGAMQTSVFGGLSAGISSGGQTSVGGTLVHLGGNIVEADAQVFKTHGIQDLNSCLPPLGKILDVPEPKIPLDAGPINVEAPNINLGGG